VVEAFNCIVPLAVYNEVVTAGKVHRYPDAEAIEAALGGKAEIVRAEEGLEPGLGLGVGEMAILSLLPQARDAVIVSDDRRFLTVLGAEGISFLTPADLLVVMARRGMLTEIEAREALERLRPAIRTRAYWDTRAELGAPGERTDEQN
jgi:hypothetical protein